MRELLKSIRGLSRLSKTNTYDASQKVGYTVCFNEVLCHFGIPDALDTVFSEKILTQ